MNEKQKKKLEEKLISAIGKLGISWASYSSLIEFKDNIRGQKIPIAYWTYNTKSKKEKIVINPDIALKLTIQELSLVIQHEILHKAMYRGIEGADNDDIKQIAMDAAINKILFMSTKKSMIKLCDKFYQGNARYGISCLCNPSTTNDEYDLLKENLKEVFKEIYLCRDGYTCRNAVENLPNRELNYKLNKHVPDPISLYYSLSAILEENQIEEFKDGSPFYMEMSSDDSQNEDDEDYENNPNDKNEEDQEDNEGNNEQEDKEANEDNDEDGKGNNDEQEEESQDDNEEDSKDEEGDDENSENEEKDSGDNKENNDEDDESNEENNEDDYDLIRGGENNRRSQSNEDIGLEKRLCQEIARKVDKSCNYYSREVSRLFNKLVFRRKNLETISIENFIREFKTRKQIEEVTSSIYEEVLNRPTIDPYAFNLSRTGIELLSLGISGGGIDQIPLFWNHNNLAGKKVVTCYFDVSPSITSAIPYIISIVDFLDNCDEIAFADDEFEGKYVFSGRVSGLSKKAWREFKCGHVMTGYSTCFDEVLKHALEKIDENKSDIIVVFTDGLSSLRYPEKIKKFNDSNRKCYNVYLDQYKDHIESDLDKLNGKSITINYKVKE